MTRVLITGADGQLGRSLQETAASGMTIIAAGRETLDLADDESIRAGIAHAAPNVVINAAAYTAVDRAESEPALARRINADAVRTLAAACEAAGIRLVQLSTDFVFAGNDRRPLSPEDPTGPSSVYGQTKLEGESHALNRCAEARVVRTSWVYSEHGHNFVKTMLQLAGRDELTVVDDQIGTPTYARHLAEALWTLLEVWPAERILHVADAGETSWCEFARAIFATATAAGLVSRAPTVRPVSTAEYAAPAPRPAYSVLDTRRTGELLGRAMPPWQNGLEEMLGRLVHNQNAEVSV